MPNKLIHDLKPKPQCAIGCGRSQVTIEAYNAFFVYQGSQLLELWQDKRDPASTKPLSNAKQNEILVTRRAELGLTL
jgi:hypothetical protein